MTLHDAIHAGYSLSRIGRAWLLTYRGQPLTATFRPPYTLLAMLEVHSLVQRTVRHGMRKV